MPLKIFYRISQLTAALILLGWAAVVYTALFVEGGHPPPSAYVGMFTIFGSWVLNTVGTLCGAVGVWAGHRTVGQIAALIVNAALLVFSLLIAQQ